MTAFVLVTSVATTKAWNLAQSNRAWIQFLKFLTLFAKFIQKFEIETVAVPAAKNSPTAGVGRPIGFGDRYRLDQTRQKLVLLEW